MSADWHPDPFGRAQFRYHDGTAWTHHVATNGQQSLETGDVPLAPPPPGLPAPIAYPFPTPPPRPSGGRLIAAGVLAIVSGGLTALMSVVLFVAVSAQSGFDDCRGAVVCGPSGVPDTALITTMATFFASIGALFIVAGIGGCMRRHWGQIMIITIGTLGVILYMVVLALNGRAAMIIPIAWFGLVTGLAVGVDREVFQEPSNR